MSNLILDQDLNIVPFSLIDCLLPRFGLVVQFTRLGQYLNALIERFHRTPRRPY